MVYKNNGFYEKYKPISLHMDKKTVLRLKKFADENNCSQDETVNAFIEYGLNNYTKAIK